MAKTTHDTFPDFLREHAEKVEDFSVRSMLLRSASSIEKTVKKLDTKFAERNMEAFACFMFDLLMEHNPSLALREELLKIVTYLYIDEEKA